MRPWLPPVFIDAPMDRPHFIFLACVGKFSSAELLKRFDLADYRRTVLARRLDKHVIFAEDGRWLMIADDWAYTLWHKRSTRAALAAIAGQCDVFSCSVGDCDQSFEFEYYRNGQMVRQYVVQDHDFQGGKVAKDIGEPLPGEAVAFEQKDPRDIVLNIAMSLGIKTDYMPRDIRVYAPRGKQWMSLMLGRYANG